MLYAPYLPSVQSSFGTMFELFAIAAAVLGGCSLRGGEGTILGVIIGHIDKIGYPPTIVEIGKEFGILSTNGSDDHLRALVRKGYIRRKPHAARAIVVLKRVEG